MSSVRPPGAAPSGGESQRVPARSSASHVSSVKCTCGLRAVVERQAELLFYMEAHKEALCKHLHRLAALSRTQISSLLPLPPTEPTADTHSGYPDVNNSHTHTPLHM